MDNLFGEPDKEEGPKRYPYGFTKAIHCYGRTDNKDKAFKVWRDYGLEENYNAICVLAFEHNQELNRHGWKPMSFHRWLIDMVPSELKTKKPE